MSVIWIRSVRYLNPHCSWLATLTGVSNNKSEELYSINVQFSGFNLCFACFYLIALHVLCKKIVRNCLCGFYKKFGSFVPVLWKIEKIKFVNYASSVCGYSDAVCGRLIAYMHAVMGWLCTEGAFSTPV